MSKINSEKVDVLFIGNLEHNDEFASFSRARKKQQPHTDEILMHRPVKVHLFRIVRPKRDIYKKYHSITQTEKPIKNFEIFYRNLCEDGSRYSLFLKSGEENLLANLNDDILISSKEGIYTDCLVVRGFFTKITVCVYGYFLKEEQIRDKCPLWANGTSLLRVSSEYVQLKEEKEIKEINQREEKEQNIEEEQKVEKPQNIEHIEHPLKSEECQKDLKEQKEMREQKEQKEQREEKQEQGVVEYASQKYQSWMSSVS